MLALESLGCEKPPRLQALTATLSPGELVAICGANLAERSALVELLAGYRSESSGTFSVDGVRLSARERRSAVAVLPRGPALTADLTVGEHVRLVSRLRGQKVGAVLEQVLAFARIDKPRRRPNDLEPAARLRLTVALCMLPAPKLAIALDPPSELVEVMVEMLSGGCAQLVVTEQLVGLDHHVSRALGLVRGTLLSGLVAPQDAETRSFAVRLSGGGASLEALLSTQGGVRLSRMGENRYRLEVAREVPLAPLLRSLLAVGVVFESLTAVGERVEG